MPPQRGMWIPPAIRHQVKIVGDVSLQSLYLEPTVSEAMPASCQVVGISSFMRGLMTEALALPLGYDLNGRAGALMQLIQFEMQRLPILPLSHPYPADPLLAERCHQFVQRPAVHETIDDWSRALGMGRHTFTRFSGTRPASALSRGDIKRLSFTPCRALQREKQSSPSPGTSGTKTPLPSTMMLKRVFGSPRLAYLGRRKGNSAHMPKTQPVF